MREIHDNELLAEIDVDTLGRLLESLPDDLEIVGAPREGIVLMTRREGLGERFHLGEVLASECRVRYRGVDGWGAVLGDDPRRALVAAALDAFDNFRPTPPARADLDPILDAARSALAARRLEEASLSAATRVEFDLLPGA